MEKELVALRKDNDGYAERFRGLEDRLRAALTEAAAWQAKHASVEERWAQVVREKGALVADAAAAKSDLKQTKQRLERLELEVHMQQSSGSSKVQAGAPSPQCIWRTDWAGLGAFWSLSCSASRRARALTRRARCRACTLP
jgi:hypothetical protein